MRVVWTNRAEKDAQKLGARTRKRVFVAFERYAETAHGDVRKLKGYNPPLYRLRVGDYRAIFRLEEDTLVVLRVRHRRDAY